jgi:acetyl-CoA/propionyl-CoA carboxylase biotin carboxyl carrier protein
MGAAAVKVAKACGYVNAGTVEFLYQEGEFYFLEMNTRLQVEHPVTEATTGLDLVALQLAVASGEPLPFTQDEIVRRGHSIEVRVNAEDPAGGKFLPSPGTITKFTRPDGYGVRTDAGYESGDTVSQYYDNLIAKIIVTAADRETAIGRTIRALEETVVEGVATTLPADLAILRHPDFVAGTHSTRWVGETLDLSQVTSTVQPAPESDDPLVAKDVPVEVDGRRFQVRVWVPETSGPVVRSAPRRKASSSTGASTAAGSGNVAVPMQGTIVKVLVDVGQEVESGQAVVVLEAMKMENHIAADKNGTVTEIKVKPGDTVGGGDIVVVIS